jgi:hypothetical protein
MRLVNNNILLEKKASSAAQEANKNSTHRSNVNEYLLAHEMGVLAGHGGEYNPRTGLSTTPGFTESDKKAAEKKYLTSKKKISPEEHNHQWERAKKMAKQAFETFRNRPDEHGGPLDLRKSTHFAVSAGSNAVSKLTGDESIDSKENTSDVIGRLPGQKGKPDMFPGVSAKSNAKSTEEGGERFSNRAVSGISDNIKEPRIHDDFVGGMEHFADVHGISHLPLSSEKGDGGRKEVIRKGEKKSKFVKGGTVEDDAEWYGSQLKSNVRDQLHDWINHHGSDPSNSEGVERVRQHLLDHHFREKGSSHPVVPFITVSGAGDGSNKNPYTAHGHFSYDNPRVKILRQATHISASPAGEYGMNIFAHTHDNPEGVHIMKLDSKWNSQPMASSMKVIGTEGDTRRRKTDFIQKQEAAKSRAAAKQIKKPAVKRTITEGYELSGDDAFQMLTLGTDMDDINLNENHKNYLKDSKGNVRIFMIRGAAAKEAHIKGGKVVPYSRGYAVLLEENQNDYHVFEKSIRSESGYNGGQETSSRSTLIAESTESGRNTSDTSGGKEAGQQSYAERKGTLTFKEITARKINESKSSSKENEKITESIDKGIEPGLSMATSGENMMRGAIRNKALKKPLEELTGDETTASIGDQKEDELRKKGISLTTFKKRNYV